MYHYTRNRCIALLLCVLLTLCCIGEIEAECTHPIYCTGPVLAAVELAGVFNDSKTFVDMPLKSSPAEILLAFSALSAEEINSTVALAAFVHEHFYPAGADIERVVPTDWVESPQLFEYIKDAKALELAKFINLQWLELVGRFNDSFCEDCYSHISVPYPFVMAGSRFREFYYWDTFWALDGLLLSGMAETAYGVVKNLLYMVQEIGFMPNGGRIYYLNRSQPPLLTQMVRLYHAFNPNISFLQEALPILDSEYNYWMTLHGVTLGNDTLNRYIVNTSQPRPESYKEDVATAAGLSEEGKANIYQQLATTAESGWDFSTRWMSNPPELASLVTTDILPVDLNCILYANELTLSDLHEQLGNAAKSQQYRSAAAARLTAIQTYLWNDTTLSWNDYNIVTKQQNVEFYASQFVPFWAGVYEVLPHAKVAGVIKNLLPQFNYSSGIPASSVRSGQQWDSPNGWSPLQYWAVEGFAKVTSNPDWEDPVLSRQITTLSNSLVDKWVTTMYCTYKQYGIMFEKYDVSAVGSSGHGGEYTVQAGFGWTNGVALRFMAENADILTVGYCPNLPPPATTTFSSTTSTPASTSTTSPPFVTNAASSMVMGLSTVALSLFFLLL